MHESPLDCDAFDIFLQKTEINWRTVAAARGRCFGAVEMADRALYCPVDGPRGNARHAFGQQI